MKLSIVATLYESSSHIREFYERSTASAKKIAGDSYEIIFVDDGSPDDGLALAVRIHERDPHVVVVSLARNFGHHKAMMTGLAHAKGEHVFLIDSDLEEEPEWLFNFDEIMKQEGCDVVYGVQKERKGKWFEQWSGSLFWRLVSLLSGLPILQNTVTARLMRRKYVDALLLHEEREIFMAGLWIITGFEQKPVAVLKHSTSNTTYTLRRKLSLFVNSVTSFSSAPLVGIFYTGTVIFLFACSYALYLIVRWLFFSEPLAGWTSIMASIWLLGGIIVSSVGVIGIYLSKVFSETKRRPYTIIKNIYDRR